MMLKIGQLVSCRFVLSVVNGQLAVRAALFSPSAPPSTAEAVRFLDTLTLSSCMLALMPASAGRACR